MRARNFIWLSEQFSESVVFNIQNCCWNNTGNLNSRHIHCQSLAGRVVQAAPAGRPGPAYRPVPARPCLRPGLSGRVRRVLLGCPGRPWGRHVPGVRWSPAVPARRIIIIIICKLLLETFLILFSLRLAIYLTPPLEIFFFFFQGLVSYSSPIFI